MPVPILHRTTVSLLAIYFTQLQHEGTVMVVFSTTLLVYCSAIYPQGKTLKYGLGGRLSKSWICPCIYVGFCRLNMCPQLSNAASAGLCDVPRNTGWESSFLPCFVLLNMLTCLTDSTLSLIGHKITNESASNEQWSLIASAIMLQWEV